MSENNLFQFAQVIAELPIQNSPQPSTSQPPQSHHPQQQQQHSDTIHNYNTRYLRIRKVMSKSRHEKNMTKKKICQNLECLCRMQRVFHLFKSKLSLLKK